MVRPLHEWIEHFPPNWNADEDDAIVELLDDFTFRFMQRLNGAERALNAMSLDSLVNSSSFSNNDRLLDDRMFFRNRIILVKNSACSQ